MTPLAGAVIVHYGEDEICHSCLRSLLDSTGLHVLPVVVDNNKSPSSRLERLLLAAGGLYFSHPENPGFASAGNIGIRVLLAIRSSSRCSMSDSNRRRGTRRPARSQATAWERTVCNGRR